MVLAGGTIPDLLGEVNPYVELPKSINSDTFNSEKSFPNVDLSNIFNPNLGHFNLINSYKSASNIAANELNDNISNGELTNPRDYLEDETGILQHLLVTANQQNALNYQTAKEVREFNANEAEKARQFQLAMRDSQIQSTMKQLADSGWNPLLAISGSMGYANASSPASASASNISTANDNSIVSAIIIAIASIASSALRSSSLIKKLLG